LKLLQQIKGRTREQNVGVFFLEQGTDNLVESLFFTLKEYILLQTKVINVTGKSYNTKNTYQSAKFSILCDNDHDTIAEPRA
jgi:hypothetical protein